jgi:hypothetical protein
MSCKGVLYVIVESGDDIEGSNLIMSTRDLLDIATKFSRHYDALVHNGKTPIFPGHWYTMLTINL